MSKICTSCGYSDESETKKFCPKCGMPMINFSEKPIAEKETERSDIVKNYVAYKKDADERIAELNVEREERERRNLLSTAKDLDMDVKSLAKLSTKELKKTVEDEQRKQIKEEMHKWLKPEDAFDDEDEDDYIEDEEYDIDDDDEED